MTLNDSYSLTIYNNTEIEIECYVEDNYTSSELPDYNVSFYRNNTLLGTNTTNKAGIARYYYDVTIDSSPQTFIFKCNITDEPSKYFNDSVKNYNETTLTVYELGIQALANPSSTTFGNTVEIIANITGNVTPIEFVQANISFTNLTNGQYVQAYETLNLSWKQSFSSTDHEYNFNYTPPRPSNYSVNVTVKAVREKWDTTNFQVWGSSKLDNITVSDDYIYNATSVQIHCLVKDNKTGDGISGYNISFYSNESLLITNTTDNSGWATYDYLINATSLYQEFNIKCNITDDPSKYYNITSEYYKETNVTVVDLSLQVTSSSYSVNYGDSVTIYANITGNATEITSVVINASYINVSNGKLVQASENGTMEYSKSYSPTEHEYNIQPYTPLSSGTWNVNVTVQAGKVKSNTTSINVSFGVPTITFISPNYRIMINQTFTFTANISSTGGDLWYTDLTVGISNESVTNVTGQYSLPDLYNLTSGSSILANWYMESKGVGLTSVVLNVTPQNGSFRSDSSSHKIIFPILTSDDVNITQNTILRTKIIGNITPIDSVNLTVTLPYTQDIFNFTSIFVGNATVSNCTGEAITTGRLTISPNATCSGNNCDYTIDNDTDTSMSLGGATPNLTIILDSEQTIERILLYWERVIGSGNSTIYYNSSGTWTTITELSELTVPEPPKEYTNITGFTPFKTNAFFMNNTPSLAVNIYEFEAYGVLGRIGICYVYEYNFSDTTRSGTYVFDSITTTENATVKTDSTFLVNFGYPQIEITAATPTAILTGYDDLYYAKITAYNGDLRNLSVNLTIYNMSVIQNQTPTTPLLKNVSAILDGDSETVFFNITALEDGVTNTSVWTNSTTNEGYYNQSTNHSIETVPNPGDLPNVTNFWFKYQESTIDKTNLNTGLAIYANVSDDRGIKYVKANVTYPSPENISINVTMAWHDTTGNWEVWNYTFGSDWPLNRTGNYTVRIIAGDIGYQEKLSGIDEGSPENMTFYVNDTYTIDFLAPHPSILMRGESVKIEAKDINGNTVDNINWNVNVTKKNETEQNITTTTGFIYTVKNNDPEVNYSIFANATKDGNSGIGSREFDVNRTYTIELNEGPSTTSPGKGSPLNLYFILSDARGGMPTGDRYGYITCLNMSYLTKSFVLTFTNQAGSDTSNCYAPNTASTQFNIITNVSDGSNNTGEETFSFTTQSEGDDGGDGRRGGGGGPAGPTCTPEADYETNCTDERDNDCDGATDCADADCSDFQACIKRIPDFEFTLSPTEIQIIQGQDADVTGSMSNTGNVKLLLTTSVDVEKDCCSIDIPSSFNVPEKRTTGFNLTIHVNASTQPGDYVINVKISYYNLQNSQSIKVTVIPNDIITNILETLPSQLSKLISEIQEYKYVGVDVSHLEERIRKIQSTIEDARDSVQEDDLEVLKTYSNDIESDMEYVNAEKTRLALQKLIYENKYNITYGVIIGIVFSYLIIRVIAPFIRLSRGIVKLNFEKTALLQSRKQAEKQYFLRKIDEQTFRRIVTEKHSQILKLASTINLTKEQRINLLKKRLNPLYIGEYLKKKLSKKEPKKESK